MITSRQYGVLLCSWAYLGTLMRISVYVLKKDFNRSPGAVKMIYVGLTTI